MQDHHKREEEQGAALRLYKGLAGMKPYLFFFTKLSIDRVLFSQRRLISTDLETNLKPKNLENLRLLFPSNRSTANLMSLTKSETSSPVLIFQTFRIEIIEATSFASSGPAKMRTPSFSSEAVPVSLQIEEHQQCTNRRAPFIHHCTKGKNTFCNTTICRKKSNQAGIKGENSLLADLANKDLEKICEENKKTLPLARSLARGVALKRSSVSTS